MHTVFKITVGSISFKFFINYKNYIKFEILYMKQKTTAARYNLSFNKHCSYSKVDNLEINALIIWKKSPLLIQYYSTVNYTLLIFQEF